MSALQDRLQRKHGPGQYLTHENLDWAGGLKLKATSETFQRSAQPEMDALISDHDLAHGGASGSLGHFPIDGDLLTQGFNRAHLFGVVIKEPGSDEHVIPAQMAPLQPMFEALINHEYSGSSYATGKICVVMMRLLPLPPNTKQITQDKWHIHKGNIAEQDFYIKEMKKYGMSDDTVKILKMGSRNMRLNEGYFSNLAPTIIQTAPTAEALSTRGKLTTRSAKNPDLIPHRQAGQWELVTSNGSSNTHAR